MCALKNGFGVIWWGGGKLERDWVVGWPEIWGWAFGEQIWARGAWGVLVEINRVMGELVEVELVAGVLGKEGRGPKCGRGGPRIGWLVAREWVGNGKVKVPCLGVWGPKMVCEIVGEQFVEGGQKIGWWAHQERVGDE